MEKITIYTSRFCPYCIQAKQLFEKKNVEFDEISVDGKPQLRAEMAKEAGRTSVPQIWIGNKHIGGCDDLFRLEYCGELDQLLPN